MANLFESIAGGLGNIVGGLSGDIANAAGVRPANLIKPVDQQQLQTAYGQTQTGIQNQQDLINQIGLANQAYNPFLGQANLAQQLQGLSQGVGPNPAQNMLNQATGQNVANQAALMAGQRGSNANVGLLARQIGQQGAGIQQQAAGQAATLGAQQQLAAMQALQSQQAQMAGQQQNANIGYNQAVQGQQGNLLQGTQGYNAALSGQQNALNQARMGIFGGLMQGGGTAAAAFAHDGGMVGYAQGGQVGPMSEVGKMLQGMACGGMMMNSGGVPGKANTKGDSIKNDKVPAMLSPGEIVIPRSIAQSDGAGDKAKAFVEAILARHKLG